MRRKKGFTLVEVIVVLVILGILAAILVPALLGWIDKARNQDAILECRSVVMAAQGKVAEIYAKNSRLDIKQEINAEDTRKEILKLAGTENGFLNANIKIGDSSNISYLEYRTEKKINVIYDIIYNPTYRIVEDFNQRGTNGQEHYENLVDKMEKEGYLGDSGNITQKLLDKVVNEGAGRNEKNQNVSRVLQDYFMNEVGAGEYPELTEMEKETIKKAVGNYKESENVLEGTSWRPIVAKNGEIMLVAAKGNGYGNALHASVVYYDGHYFAWTHSYDGRLTTRTVGDGVSAVFDISSLTEEGTLWKLLE